MNIPTLDWETVEVVSHVLYPASMPDCRFVVITWVEGGGDDERDALGGTRDAWAATTANQDDVAIAQRHAENRAAEDAATRWRREAAALASRTVVSNAEEAAALAGADGVPLPAISQVLGRDVQLTLAPDQRTVVWAVEEAIGIWSVTHVSPATVVARVPRGVLQGARLARCDSWSAPHCGRTARRQPPASASFSTSATPSSACSATSFSRSRRVAPASSVPRTRAKT